MRRGKKRAAVLLGFGFVFAQSQAPKGTFLRSSLAKTPKFLAAAWLQFFFKRSRPCQAFPDKELGQARQTAFPIPGKLCWMKFVLIAALLVATVFLQAGCSNSHGADTDAPQGSSNDTVSNTTITLTGDQLNAITIAPVGTYLFPVEKEEVGSISFDEDPNTVQAESTLLGATAAEEVATNVLVRAQALYGTNGVSKAELEQDISAEETAEAAFKSARYAVLALGETDDEIDQMLAAGRIEAAQGVHSPPRWVLANVAESDVPLIQVGQPVQVKVMAFPDRVFAGTVSEIYATIDPNTHRMAVRCEVDDPRDELCVGMLATVVIEVSKPVEATAIPANGVVREGDGTMTAWVTADRQHFTQRIIKTGMREDGEVQILDGLQPGELAVTDGAVFLDNMLQAPSDD
jgi:cobalt-zinc-cadmium efflux system membrane fusion protein